MRFYCVWSGFRCENHSGHVCMYEYTLHPCRHMVSICWVVFTRSTHSVCDCWGARLQSPAVILCHCQHYLCASRYWTYNFSSFWPTQKPEISVIPKHMQTASNFMSLSPHLTESSFEHGKRNKWVQGMGAWAGGRKVSVGPHQGPCICNTDLQIGMLKFKIFSLNIYGGHHELKNWPHLTKSR